MLLLVAAALAVGTTPGSGSAPAGTALPTLRSPTFGGANVSGTAAVSGPVTAPGGPYLYDRQGRIVFFHGVDAVYKHPPYVLYADPGKPWNFSVADASLMARLGFNVVRLGVTWSGLEPGTAPANDPAICGPGPPADPHQFDQAVFDRYVNRVRETVALLGRFHIYTILDMHQDVYNEMFDGEGAPKWAVCTNGLLNVDRPGRWSLEYGTPAAGAAFSHFWRNDVRGDLQGEYDRVWGNLARAFRGNRWVLGYDPFNEPFSRSLVLFGDEHFDAQLECFYTGTRHIGVALHAAPALTCPYADPANGVIPTILAGDPAHLIFDEPDNYGSRGYPTYLGPMNLRNLVFNVHVYCGARSPVTGDPTDPALCAAQDAHSLAGADRGPRGNGLGATTRRARVARHRIRRHQERGTPDVHHRADGRAAGRMGVLGLEVLRRSDGEPGRVAGDGRRPAALHGPRPEPRLSRGGRRRPALLRVLPGVRRVPPHLRARPPRPCAHRGLRADAAPRPARLLRRRARGRVTSAEGSDLLEVDNGATGHRVTVTVTPGECRAERNPRSGA